MGAPIFESLWSETLTRRDAAFATALADTPGAQGIDCSSWQGVVGWSPVAVSGRSFAMIKACEGTNPSYPTLDAQYQGAVAAGLTVGLYAYALPNLSPEDSADALAAQALRLGAISGHLPLAVDVEEGDGNTNVAAWCYAFITQLRERTGCQQVMVYSNTSFFEDYIGEDWMDDDVLLWLADYSSPPGRPSYWSPRVAIHQYSQTGIVPGVAGDVDLNYALYPLSQLIVGEDMTPDQAAQLATVSQQVGVLTQQVADIHQQLLGLYNAWPGGKTDANNTPYDILQFVLRNNVEIVQAGVAADEIRQAIAALNIAPGGELTVDQVNQVTAAVEQVTSKLAPSVDVKGLADELVAEFLAKLSTLPAEASGV